MRAKTIDKGLEERMTPIERAVARDDLPAFRILIPAPFVDVRRFLLVSGPRVRAFLLARLEEARCMRIPPEWAFDERTRTAAALLATDVPCSDDALVFVLHQILG